MFQLQPCSAEREPARRRLFSGLGGLQRPVLLASLLALSATQACLGQSITGDIISAVTDPAGGNIPNADLTLTRVDTGQQTHLKTDGNGLAVFSSLKPGNYKLVVAHEGFRVTQLDNITVVIGQRVNLDVHMQIGASSESVTVSASEAALLNSESAAVGQVINQNSIQTLPLNGRNFMQLTQLTTGAAPIGAGNSPATTWTGRSDTTVSLAGLRESDTSFLVNGIETRNSRFGNTGIRPSVDAIQEFRVQRTTFGAEFGHAASIINTEILSGANPFHLVLFELNRNRAYAANTYFAKQAAISQPALNQNTFGGTFSGPMWFPKVYNGRNRTFFMFNYEGFRLIQGQTLTSLYPSVAQLQGNLADDSAGTGLIPTTSPFCATNRASIKCVDILNPLTGQPFAGNVIPKAQLDPTAQKALQFIPGPNVLAAGGAAFPSFNTIATPRSNQIINQYNVRLDHRFSERDSIYATWSNSNDNLFNPAINPLGGTSVPLNDHLWTATYLHTFTPTLVNEFRFGANDSATFRNAESAFGPNYAGGLFGLPYANGADAATYGVPIFGIAGFGPVGSIAEVIGADDKYYQVSDNVTWTHGKLTSMNGVQYIHENFTQITDFASNPTLSYSNGYSVRDAAGKRVSSLGLSDFLLGQPYEITAAQGDSTQYLHTAYYGLYSQNNWKVLPSLTLNLGLRYEYAGPPIESRNRSQFFDTTTGQFQYAGTSIRRSIVKPDYNNFAPRVGFAWRPAFLQNTVVRGGVGTYYATDNFNEEQFKNQGSPFYTSQSNTPSSTTPVSIFNPFAGVSNSFPPPNANIFTLDQNNRTSYINQWGLDIQQSFAKDFLLELEYAGSSGQKLAQRKNANIGAIDPTGTVPLSSRKAFPQYGFILVSSNYGRSNYNALTAKLEKRMSHGNSFLVAYTFSKAIDIGITDDFSALSRDFFRYDRGVSDYNVPNRLVISYALQLPFGRGQHFLSRAPLALDYIVGGWQLNGITSFSSGQYSTPTLSGDNLNIGDFSQSRPNLVGNPRAGRNTPLQWFNAAAFAQPAFGTPGNAGRNSLQQPGFQNWDASLFKSLSLTERAKFQLRFEAFNIFNHTQFGSASTSLGPGFGAITSTRAARIVQLGGRFQF
ncbi:putative collagen-binding protein [Terriglobus roseus DSM 18391]|uniref:Putative collagen-binding protein n=1 Tax=Terriglobus roseus (strain DSM 18391 / NRRL B-41598 / KBS 63) TaxID=926566 RepID=I3ZIV8_TERRK|nr:putative collagen-binding protein [Terriglobus roseus DSM 18391]